MEEFEVPKLIYNDYEIPSPDDLPEMKLNVKLVTERKGFFDKNLEGDWGEYWTLEQALEWAHNQTILQVDMEANTLHHFLEGKKVWSLQIGRPDCQVIVDAESVDLYEFRELLEESGKTILGQNIKYDLVWLFKQGERGIALAPDRVLDTLVAEQSLSLGKKFEHIIGGEPIRYRRDLAALVKRYLGTSIESLLEVSKEPREDVIKYGIARTDLLQYSAKDVMVLEHILSHQYKALQAEKVTVDFLEECRNLVAIAYMEFCGTYLHWEDRDRNVPSWLGKCEEDEYQKGKALHELDAYVAKDYPHAAAYIEFHKPLKDKYNIPTEDYLKELSEKEDMEDLHHFSFRKWILDNYPEVPKLKLPPESKDCVMNWSSSQKTGELFKLAGIDIYDSKNKKESVDAQILGPQKDAFPIIPLYLRFKQAEKRCSTYGRNWEVAIQDDGRIHTTFKLAVDTGRMSSGGKQDRYVNLQNIPGDPASRSAFRGQGPNMICAADYSDQEGHVSAELSGDPSLRKFYNEGYGDKHAFVASMTWGTPFEDITAAKARKDNGEALSDYDKECLSKRTIAKQVGFALMYGGDYHTLMGRLGMSEDEAKRVETAFFKAFGGMRNYMERQKKFVRENGYVLINEITGKKRFFSGMEQVRADEAGFEAMRKKYGKTIGNRKYLRHKWHAALRNLATKENGAQRVEQAKATKEAYYHLLWKLRKFWSLAERQAINTPVQGTAAMITKRAATYVYQYIHSTRSSKSKDRFGKFKIINMVHDEILIEGHMKSIDGYTGILVKCMEHAAKEFCPSLNMGVVPAIGKYWIH